MELEIRNVAEGDEEVIMAAAAWGLQTLLHALSIAARETGVCLARDDQDFSAVERTKSRVERILEESQIECGPRPRIERLIYTFGRRIFLEANSYLDRHHDLFGE